MTLVLVWLFASYLPLSGGFVADGQRAWVHTYHARGDVRLLVFWMGRNNVGGGRISTLRIPGKLPATWSEEIELVFGSDPERIPGKVNRWGYARERSDWEMDSRGEASLTRTVFEGLIRHSDAGSPAAVVSDNRKQVARGLYEYKAIHSEVARDGASAEIRVFQHPHEFHYRNPAPVLSQYREVEASRPPQTRDRLANSPARYSSPFGFLFGVRALIDRVVEASTRAGRSTHVSQPPLTIVHGAALYRLEVRNVEYVATWPGFPEAGEVAIIRFQAVNLARNRRSEFSIAVPLRGPLRAIPVRIVYQPNWWLRIRLDMDSPAPAHGL